MSKFNKQYTQSDFEKGQDVYLYYKYGDNNESKCITTTVSRTLKTKVVFEPFKTYRKYDEISLEYSNGNKAGSFYVFLNKEDVLDLIEKEYIYETIKKDYLNPINEYFEDYNWLKSDEIELDLDKLKKILEILSK